MAVTAATLLESFSGLMEHHSGPLDVLIKGPCAQTQPLERCVAFVSEKEHLPKLLQSKLALIVVNNKLAQHLSSGNPTILLSPNPYLAMALVNKKFFPVLNQRKSFSQERIHSSAQIHPSAKISPTAQIGPNTVIYDNVTIGEDTFIGANCVIESDVEIGHSCFIHHMVNIGHTTKIGNAVEIKPNSTIGSDGFGYAHDHEGNHFRLPHYGALIIEDDVHIGANVNVDRGTFEPARIGRGTKIDNHCHFAHNVVIGKNNLITAGFITAGSSQVGDNCVFAGRASVNGHITICSGVTIGPLTAVSNDITAPGMYMGFPPLPYRDALKVNASLGSLPRMRKNLAQVMKQLGLSEEK